MRCCLLQGQYLGVGGGILCHLAAVEPSTNDFTLKDHHGTDWNIAIGFGLIGGRQSLFHVVLVDFRIHSSRQRSHPQLWLNLGPVNHKCRLTLYTSGEQVML
jgi:hypothetical protein